LLLSNDADINLTNNKGATALIYAVCFNRPEVVKLLIEHNADVSLKDQDGLTVKDHAEKLGFEEIKDILQ
jgi:hypothetical protein